MRTVPMRGVCVLIALTLLACSRKREAALPAAPAVADMDDSARRDSIERADAARRDSLAREEQLRAERDARLASARTTLVAPVYFAFDRSDLSPDARSALDAKLPILRENSALRLRLAGHTDERGSDEYNLALGQRRAASTKRYLTAHGIGDERLDVTSFGEERPVCLESDEPCWSRNRRVEFELLAGDIAALRRPASAGTH